MVSPEDRSKHLASKIAEMTRRLELDLCGLRVLTEAATGSYVVTPVIAAFAGAEVVAFTKNSRYGSVDQVKSETHKLATELEVADRITVVDTLAEDQISQAQIVTNSGHLRPLNAERIAKMRPGTVVPLMYESWEHRENDVDLQACFDQGVIVAGTNERHPQLRIFDYLGLLALWGLFRCGVSVAFSRILLICNNPFCPFIASRLLACDAEVDVLGDAGCYPGSRARRADEPNTYDAVVVASTPSERPTVGPDRQAEYTFEQIGEFDALVQIWGDVNRKGLHGVRCEPPLPPTPGQMGIPLSTLGTDPVIRLQAGGLKVGQEIIRAISQSLPMETATSYLDAVLVSGRNCNR